MLRNTVIRFTDSRTGATHEVTWETLKRYMLAYQDEHGRLPTRDELFAYYLRV